MEPPRKKRSYKMYNNYGSESNIPDRTARRWKSRRKAHSNEHEDSASTSARCVVKKLSVDEVPECNKNLNNRVVSYIENDANKDGTEGRIFVNFTEHPSNDESLTEFQGDQRNTPTSLRGDEYRGQGIFPRMDNELENESADDRSNDESREEPLANDGPQSAQKDRQSVGSGSTQGYSMERLKQVLMLMATKLRHNLTYAATEDISKLLNISSDNSESHTSKYYFKQILSKFSGVVSVHHICPSCEHYAGKQVDLSDENEILCCQSCKTDLSTKANIDSGTIFLYLSLKDQLKEIMESSGDAILYREQRTKQNHFAVEDIFDGTLYKKAAQNSDQWSDTITMTFSFDGVPIFEASNYSAHPILCLINELPPKERRKNIMMCSVWCGKEKPVVNDYFSPFVAECQELFKDGFDYFNNGRKINKNCQLIMGICDSVARPMAQQPTQFNGKYGCSLCLHPGIQVTKGRGTVRVYPIDLSGNAYGEGLRTHIRSLRHMSRKEKGFKARSILCDLSYFNIVLSLPVDYMDCILLGVCRQLARLWFDSDNHDKDYYLGAVLSIIDIVIQTNIGCIQNSP